MNKDNNLVIAKKAVIAEFVEAARRFTRTKAEAKRLVEAIVKGRKTRIPDGFHPTMWCLANVIAEIEEAQLEMKRIAKASKAKRLPAKKSSRRMKSRFEARPAL